MGSRGPRRLGRSPATVAAPKPPPDIKRLIWTGAFTVATIASVVYGVGLKTQHEFEGKKNKVVEATPEERIKLLEDQRDGIMSSRIPLELKLQQIQARIKAAEEEETKKAAQGKTKPS